MNQIGINIKKRRYELRMSQQELANALGYKTRSSIAKIESGENSITIKKLEEFARILDISTEALVSGEQHPFERNLDTQGKNTSKAIAIILAGGKSTRNQQNIPSQFINILGKPVIIYTMEAYQNHPAVTDIYVVCLSGWEDILLSYANQFNISKLRHIITGGKTGILSVKNAVEYLNEFASDSDIVIFQESTRPLISEEMISNLLNAVKENESAVMCDSMKDRLQFMSFDTSTKYVDRNRLVEVQSPEAYRFGTIKTAFTEAQKKNSAFDETCCALFMYNNNYKLRFITGSHYNMKLIRQEDISLVTALLKTR